MPGNYDEYVKVSEAGTKAVLPEFHKILPDLDGKSILDVGCGTGLMLEHYAAKNNVMGLDSNTKSLAAAKRRGISVKQHDLEKKLPFPDNSFDLVICKDVLEFIFNAEQLLNEMVRVTKKGGLLLLHVPNEFTLIDLLNLALGNGILKRRWYANSTELNNPHIRFFTVAGLRETAAKSGLEIKSDYSGRWAFTLPVLGLRPGFLSKIFPPIFSPGITLLCTKK